MVFISIESNEYAKFPRGKFTILARAKYNQLGREERCSLSKL